MIEATTTPRHHHVQENDDDELDDEENNMNGEHSTDLRDNDDEINDPVSLSCQKVPKSAKKKPQNGKNLPKISDFVSDLRDKGQLISKRRFGVL